MIASLIGHLLARARQAISVIRLKPFDSSEPHGRSLERLRRVVLTALAMASAKGISVLTALISVPLTIKYLGTERYGLWMTISSVIAFLAFTDLGMGNGLVNGISEANGKDDRAMAKEYVSSAFFMLTGLAIILALIFILIYPRIPWNKLFNVSSAQAVIEAGPAMAIFIGCFLLNMPLGVVQRIQMGYQEGFANSMWQAVGSVFGLIGVIAAIRAKAGLPSLVLAMAGGPVLATLINGYILVHRKPWLLPKRQNTSGRAAQRVLNMGILFFIIQLAGALAFSSDNIIAAQLLGPAAVAEYSVVMRMFSIFPMFISMILVPLWPAYGESFARGDVVWIKKTLLRSLTLAVIFVGIPSVLLVVFGVKVLKIWIGPIFSPSILLLLGVGLWKVIEAAGTAVAMFLNGINRIGFQAVVAILMSIGALVGKVLLARVIGLPGIIWGTIIAFIFFETIPLSFYIPRLLTSLVICRPSLASGR